MVERWQAMKRTELTREGNAVTSARRVPRIHWAVCRIVVLLCCATANPQEEQAKMYFIHTGGWSLGRKNQTLPDHEKKIVELEREHSVVLSIGPGHPVFRLKDDR
jgi:hypothetical protein